VRRLPVRWRLTLAFALVMAVVLSATGLFVYQRQASNLDGSITRALAARANDVGALAQQSESGLRDARPGPAGRRAEVAQLIDASGRVWDRTPGVPRRPLISSAQLATARQGRPVTTDVVLSGDESVRVLAEPVRAQGQRLVVVVGQSLEARNSALEDLSGVLLVGGPAALLLASLAGYLLTGAALRPVEAMRRRAAAISAADLDQRLTPAGGQDELGRLGRTLNEMLERIHRSVESERSFFSDASHELRSPLAVLRTELELIARERPAGVALQRAAGSAIEETDRLTQLADDLLLLARADDHQLALRVTTASAAELLEEAAERVRRQAADIGIGLSVDARPDTRVEVDRERIEQALGNLIANALRHAREEVTLATRVQGDLVELHVRDDGPGFPPDFLPRAWERFARADSARSDDGVGLGLAIVRTIAEAHGGSGRAANRAGGGADVWISLPATGGPSSPSSRDGWSGSSARPDPGTGSRPS
jgi:two-component system OmpR family sensor kinase